MRDATASLQLWLVLPGVLECPGAGMASPVAGNAARHGRQALAACKGACKDCLTCGCPAAQVAGRERLPGLLECDAAQHPLGPAVWHHPHQCGEPRVVGLRSFFSNGQIACFPSQRWPLAKAPARQHHCLTGWSPGGSGGRGTDRRCCRPPCSAAARHGRVWRRVRHQRQHHRADPDAHPVCGERVQGGRATAACKSQRAAGPPGRCLLAQASLSLRPRCMGSPWAMPASESSGPGFPPPAANVHQATQAPCATHQPALAPCITCQPAPSTTIELSEHPAPSCLSTMHQPPPPPQPYPPTPLPPRLQEYNSEAAFAAAVLLSFLALFTLVVKDRLEGVASQETSK